MKDGTEHFLGYWKTPKKKINAIKKQYETSKQAAEEYKKEKSEDELKLYSDMAKRVLDAYEKLSGRPVNRGVMIGNLYYWFDEGFDVEDMILHLNYSLQKDFFLQNPELFTISRLFPITNQDAINSTWDMLAYHMSKREKSLNARLDQAVMRCKNNLHNIGKNSVYCPTCVSDGDPISVAENPYAPEVPEHMKEFAFFFQRQNEESLDEYQVRTMPEFKKLHQMNLKSKKMRAS